MSVKIVAGSRVRFRNDADAEIGVVEYVELSRHGEQHDIIQVMWPNCTWSKWSRLALVSVDDAGADVADEPTPFDIFINLAPYEVPTADMWRFLPDMLDALADRWGMPLEGQAAQSWAVLTGLFQMTPDGVVSAVMATLARRDV